MCRFFAITLFIFMYINQAICKPENVGIVLMHGKGGAPTKLVKDLADGLKAHGYLVDNKEMPWSGSRAYDVSVEDAQKEVREAFQQLKKQGAQKVFLIGHSQGGAFAIFYGNSEILDGIIVIAPGGNVAAQGFSENVKVSVDTAKKMITEGKGNESFEFNDYENSRGKFSVKTTANKYFTWFDPDGAFNLKKSAKNFNAQNPFLFIAPISDYPGLKAVKNEIYNSIPKNKVCELFDIEADHKNAPIKSLNKIIQWIDELAKN